MMSWTFSCFVLSLLFLISPVSQAEQVEGSFSSTCATCETESQGNAPVQLPLKYQAAALREVLNKSIKCDDKSSEDCLLVEWLKAKFQEFSKNCQGFFINQNGEVGSFSKVISNLILSDIEAHEEQSVFVKSIADFDKYCPRYKDFSLMQKVAFHGWIFELTAFPESSCDVKVKPNKLAPTTPAVCMYQLEGPPSTRKWRSHGLKPQRCAVSYKEILTMEGCTGCAFDEFQRKMKKDGTPFGVINAKGKFISRSYWASQNPLSEATLQCFEKYSSGKTSALRRKYLKECKSMGANNEWPARAKFFKRLPRFPLCGTKESEYESQQMQKKR
jgi:hypothetical protein